MRWTLSRKQKGGSDSWSAVQISTVFQLWDLRGQCFSKEEMPDWSQDTEKFEDFHEAWFLCNGESEPCRATLRASRKSWKMQRGIRHTLKHPHSFRINETRLFLIVADL